MLKKIVHPPKEKWPELAKRPVLDTGELESQVRDIMTEVRDGGDRSLLYYRDLYDRAYGNGLEVPFEEMEKAGDELSFQLKDAINLAARNIEKFHKAQMPRDINVATMAGVTCSRKCLPLEKVGLYVPGGTAPLFSTVLMLAIPARIAGCREITVCTPPGENGKVHPAILHAAFISGVTSLYSVGGAHAVAAMTFGTETIPAVDKLFGPGNQYVTMAKQAASMWGTAIDLPAGPSELAIIADTGSNPDFVSADILSQAEHGPDSQVILTATTQEVLTPVFGSLKRQLQKLPRYNTIVKSLENSIALVFEDYNTLMEFINLYAPEHLIISTSNYRELQRNVKNAGTVFLGRFTPESTGDYSSGANHTLPTNGFAKGWSGVDLESFMKRVTFQEVSSSGLPLVGEAAETMALAEGLDGHALAVSVRLDHIKNSLQRPWEPSIH